MVNSFAIGLLRKVFFLQHYNGYYCCENSCFVDKNRGFQCKRHRFVSHNMCTLYFVQFVSSFVRLYVCHANTLTHPPIPFNNRFTSNCAQRSTKYHFIIMITIILIISRVAHIKCFIFGPKKILDLYVHVYAIKVTFSIFI